HEVLSRLHSIHAHRDAESTLDECLGRNRTRLHELALVTHLDIRDGKESRDRCSDHDTLRTICFRLRTSRNRRSRRSGDCAARRHRQNKLPVFRRLLLLQECTVLRHSTRLPRNESRTRNSCALAATPTTCADDIVTREQLVHITRDQFRVIVSAYVIFI